MCDGLVLTLRGEEGTRQLVIDGQESYVFYKPLGNTGWSVAIVCPESDIFGAFNRLSRAVTISVWEEGEFCGESIDDIRERQLLIYTDGLSEAENPQKQLFGERRLQELVAGALALNSEQVIKMLQDAVEHHRDGAAPNDDLTLLCLKLIKD